MTLLNFKKEINWNSEATNCIWIALLLAYFAITLVLQAIGACTHPNTPFVFGWPDMVWAEHPVLLTFFCLLYVILSMAAFLYGAILTETRGENSKNNQKLGNFYVKAGCMMVLSPVFNWTILTFIWVIVSLFTGIVAALYFLFYKFPIYIISADERKQKKEEEAEQRKIENEIMFKKLIKDFDKIRK